MREEISVGVLLKVTEKEIEQDFNNKAQQLGLTAAQMHTLHYICRRSGEICQRDIEARFDLSHATVSGILTRLQNKGFIETAPGSDRRRKTVTATPAARACDNEMHAFIQENNRRFLRDFSAEDTARLRGYLLRILHNLDRDFCCKQGEEKGDEK